jgi:hypothetical protein
MNSSQLAALVSAFSIFIADNIPDNDDLGLLAAILPSLEIHLTQLQYEEK